MVLKGFIAKKVQVMHRRTKVNWDNLPGECPANGPNHRPNASHHALWGIPVASEYGSNPSRIHTCCSANETWCPKSYHNISQFLSVVSFNNFHSHILVHKWHDPLIFLADVFFHRILQFPCILFGADCLKRVRVTTVSHKFSNLNPLKMIWFSYNTHFP